MDQTIEMIRGGDEGGESGLDYGNVFHRVRE